MCSSTESAKIDIHLLSYRVKEARKCQLDVEALERLIFSSRRGANAPTSSATWNQIWSQPRHMTYIARTRKDKRIVGYLITEKRKLGKRYITTLAVHPSFRGAGLATRLMNRITLEPTPPAVMSLHVSVHNTEAIRLYHKLGFTLQYRVRNYYAHGDDAFYFQKREKII